MSRPLSECSAPSGCKVRRQGEVHRLDSSSKLIEGVQNGQIDALVVQDPFKMGYEGGPADGVVLLLLLHGDMITEKR